MVEHDKTRLSITRSLAGKDNAAERGMDVAEDDTRLNANDA